MFAVTGITGQVGGEVARTLLASGQSVRAVVRETSTAAAWAALGCEVAKADILDCAALTAAFRGADGVFILVPPNFDPKPGFQEAHIIAASLRIVLESASPGRVVYLSTIGADATQPNLLTQHTIIEKTLGKVALPITFLRPGWFMENCSWDAASARERGVIPSFLQPLDKRYPMVSTMDIGRVAAELIQESWTGHRIVELEGPSRVTPTEIAATFSRLLRTPVTIEVVPRETWEQVFQSQGVQNPLPRMRMLDGFNEGWVDFQDGGAGARKGQVTLEAALKKLLG